jgi:flagellar motility protein MotE (MotC chaperone)
MEPHALPYYLVTGLASAGCLSALLMLPVPRIGSARRSAAATAQPSEKARLATSVAITAAVLLFGSAGPCLAQAAAEQVAPPPAAAAAPAESADAANSSNADRYCANLADKTADARFARQAAALDAMEKEIQDRIQQLEAKRAEYQEWMKRREEFLSKADATVVAVYTQMRPDAAAAQMAILSDDVASGILAKVNPRVASAILGEMEAPRAARLAGIMAGIAQRKTASDGKS